MINNDYINIYNKEPSIYNIQKKIEPKIENSNLNKEDNKNSISEIQEKSKINNINQKTDIKIDKIGFSYNSEVKELVVKVERNDKIYQYPSDEYLRLKKFIQETSQKT